jgi:hypothetical protein
MKFSKFLTEDQQKLLVEAKFMEMANLPPADTGLNYMIWMGEVGGQHGPRIKVSNVKGKFATNDNFVMSIAKEPINLTPKFSTVSVKDEEDVKDWIKLNYDVLMQLWKLFETGEGSLLVLLGKLKKL